VVYGLETVVQSALARRGELPQLEAGTYTIPDGTLLLLNDTDDSFDSRYLGAIESSQIDKKVFLLLSYEPFLKLIGRGKI